MAINIDYFRTIQNAIGIESESEAVAAETQMFAVPEMRESPGYVMDATRNGKPQELILSMADSYYKADIIAFPHDELYPGDMIYARGQNWIVISTRHTNPIQTIGLAWLCNYRFSWQNWSPDIIRCWGILDSGVYSTTIQHASKASTLDKQFKIYLPYNDDTSKIFIDKRFAISKRYDSDGDVVLETYKVTSFDPISSSYGEDGHLLVLVVESSSYSKDKDSIDKMICDYIEPVEKVNDFSINGSKTIRIGKTRAYTVAASLSGNILWSVSTDTTTGVTYTTDDTTLNLSVAKADSLIGQTIAITATSGSKEATLNVKVVAYG